MNKSNIKPESIIKQLATFATSSQATQLITMIAAILSRRFLGPLQMGIWSTLSIVVDYSKYASLGTLHGVAREIPYYRGVGNEKNAEEIKNVVFTVVLVGSLLIAACIILASIFLWGRLDPKVCIGLALISGVVILQALNNYFIQLLRSYKEFKIAAAQMILSAVFNAIVVALLTYNFKIYGFIVAMYMSFAFNIFYINFRRKFHVRFQYQKSRIKSLVKFGFPLMILGAMKTVLLSVDKIMIVRFLGFTQLGYYTVALMVATYMTSFFNSIAIVTIPYFQEKHGEANKPHVLTDFLNRATQAYAILMPLLVGGAWLVAPFFIGLFLPQYTGGIPAMKIMALGVFFLALSQPYQDYVITIKKHYYLFRVLFFTFILAIALNAIAIALKSGIYGIAIATSISMFFKFLATYYFANQFTRTNLRARIIYLAKIIACCVYAFICIGVALQVIPSAFDSFGMVVLRYTVFAVAYSPLLIFLNHKFKILKKLMGKI